MSCLFNHWWSSLHGTSWAQFQSSCDRGMAKFEILLHFWVFLKTGSWIEQKAFTVRERKAAMNSVAPYLSWPLLAVQQLPPPAHLRAASDLIHMPLTLPCPELKGTEGSQEDNILGWKKGEGGILVVCWSIYCFLQILTVLAGLFVRGRYGQWRCKKHGLLSVRPTRPTGLFSFRESSGFWRYAPLMHSNLGILRAEENEFLLKSCCSLTFLLQPYMYVTHRKTKQEL